MNNIGNRLYEMRKQKGISQEEFADIVNTSRQAVSKWERDEATPDLEKIILIAKYYNVSIDYLLNYEVESVDVDEFSDYLQKCLNENNINVSDEEISTWITKYPNNVKLLNVCVNFYIRKGLENKDNALFHKAINAANQLLNIKKNHNDNYHEIYSIKSAIAQIYIFLEEFGTAKNYIIDNNIYDSNMLLAKCESGLKNFQESLDILSNEYFDTIGKLLNISSMRIENKLFLKEYEDTLDVIDWSINFTDSIIVENNLLVVYIIILKFIKIVVKVYLHQKIDNDIVDLESQLQKYSKYDSTTNTLKNYEGENQNFLLYFDNYSIESITKIFDQSDNLNQEDLDTVRKIFKEKIEVLF